MAIDQTQKALNMATATVNAVNDFMSALETLESLEDERATSGINLLSYDAAYAALDSLKHVNGASVRDVLMTAIPAIRANMVTNSYDDSLNAVRSGDR